MHYHWCRAPHLYCAVVRSSSTLLGRSGRFLYAGANASPRVLNGLGVAIVSTSRGVITNKEAQKANVGGEVLCYVY